MTPPEETPEHEAGEAPAFEAEEKKSPKQIAEDYLIPMSDSAIEEWESKTGFLEYVVQIACGLYPTLAPQLNQGITTKALLDPYVQIAKKLLGHFTEIELDEPMWQKVLSGGTDPKTGKATIMPLGEFSHYVKAHMGTGYADTPEAHGKLGDVMQQLQQNQHAWDGTPQHKAVMMKDISLGAHPGGVHPDDLPVVQGE